MRKFYSTNNARNIIAIAESKEGEQKAKKYHYTRVTLKEMTIGEKSCLKAYDNNYPTYHPAIYLG